MSDKAITALQLLALATARVHVADWSKIVTRQHHARMVSLKYIKCYPPHRQGGKWRVVLLKAGFARLKALKVKNTLREEIIENPAYKHFFLPRFDCI